jgi:hypothetical protein
MKPLVNHWLAGGFAMRSETTHLRTASAVASAFASESTPFGARFRA